FIVSFSILALVLALKKFRLVLIFALLIFAGWTNLVFREAIISPNDLRNLIADQSEIVSVRGTLEQKPQIKISERNGEETEHSRSQIRVFEIKTNENWQPAFGEITVSTPNELPANFFAGQKVEISGVISKPPLPLAEGLFDSQKYFATRGVFYELKTASTNDWRLREPILSK